MKHLAHYFKETYLQEITTMPEPSLGIVVVIPCHNEPNLESSIRALANCCKPNSYSVEVLIVINFSEQANDTIKSACYKNYEEAKFLASELSNSDFIIHPILKADLLHKFAGVGLARKIGMDEAAHRFFKVGNPQGVILCFDADSTCDNDYFTVIEDYYRTHTDVQAASVWYEHPIEGEEYAADIYEGIAQYELHLRYYNQASRWVELPFAYHTVGSSMGCRASVYAKVSGMNKRKAGEDFYFLQKLIPLGHFGEINGTRVIPSPRVSDRVPFGTGRAMMKYVDEAQPQMYTYTLGAFKAVKEFIEKLPDLYKANHDKQAIILHTFHPFLATYLRSIGYFEAIDELNANCADYPAFAKRFYTWFDAFRLLKFMNWVHEDGRWAKSPVIDEAAKLLPIICSEAVILTNAKELLLKYREIERAGF